MSLREMLSDYWYAFQQELFPRLESELGPMGERYELFVAVLELVRVEALLPFRGQVGRPEEDRAALARAFIAKAVFDIPTTRALIERLEDRQAMPAVRLERCRPDFRARGAFSLRVSESRLASRLHETLQLRGRLLDGVILSSTLAGCDGDRGAGEGGAEAEGSEAEAAQAGAATQGRGCLAGDRSRASGTATDDEPSADAGTCRGCDVGSKRNAKGHTTSWIGYKLHVDTADGGIPISCIDVCVDAATPRWRFRWGVDGRSASRTSMTLWTR